MGSYFLCCRLLWLTLHNNCFLSFNNNTFTWYCHLLSTSSTGLIYASGGLQKWAQLFWTYLPWQCPLKGTFLATCNSNS